MLLGNTATANGSTANLTILETTGNNYSYSFTYSNQDFDGDGINDTLTFTTLVEGFRGGTIASSLDGSNGSTGTMGSATIGTTDRTVTSNGNGWAVQNPLFNPGESLVFTISSLSVTLTDTTKTATACATGFTNAHFRETGRSNGHLAVVGEGTGLDEARWDSIDYQFSNFDTGNETLVISAAPQNGQGSNVQRIALEDVDFGIDVKVIPEPSSAALLGISGLALLSRRRR